ncbi:DUF7504 family protein [Halomarina litorea]|uniref:DUF7504 family protein n=1 Tax=Halomarina litorea TaxID=2961595 RepID=UPI0020C1F119|nr:hypothetical protein [Halomarina sp. BCD28]
MTDTYDVEAFHPSALPAGTTILLLAGIDRQRAVVDRFLAGPSDCDDHPVTVTDGVVPEVAADGGSVDCRSPGRSEVADPRGDLREVGVRVCRSLDVADRPVRLAVYDVGRLLRGVDVQTVYRFFHVVAETVARTGAVGVFGLDGARRDAKSLNVYRRVFDYVADARSVPPGDPVPLSSVG